MKTKTNVRAGQGAPGLGWGCGGMVGGGGMAGVFG